MSRAPSPLVGYNTNVRHKGKLYHIQTEDSGVNHPHIITHLFADGGRIIASKKTDYSQYLGSETLPEIVKRLMQEQHKAMFIGLRDCVYDEDEEPGASPAPREKRISSEVDAKRPELDLDALERAAEARIAQSAAAQAPSDARKRGAGRYHQTVPAQPKSKAPRRSSSKPVKPEPPASIFGGSLMRSKSLDEVILSYLADDSGDEK